MLKKTLFIFAVLIFTFLLKPVKILGQTVSSNNNCEYNLALLDGVRSLPSKDNQIIIVAYRGKKEKLMKYSSRRLQRMKILLGDKNTVFAVGENFVTKPKVEIYVNGKLDLVFETKNREPLKAGACGN